MKLLPTNLSHKPIKKKAIKIEKNIAKYVKLIPDSQRIHAMATGGSDAHSEPSANLRERLVVFKFYPMNILVQCGRKGKIIVGWDVYAVRKLGGDAVFDWDENNEKLFIPDPTLRKAFVKDARQAKKLGGLDDHLLKSGGLDLVECAYMLERLTGTDAWGVDLSPKAVQKLDVNTFKPERNRAWAYYSAPKI